MGSNRRRNSCDVLFEELFGALRGYGPGVDMLGLERWLL